MSTPEPPVPGDQSSSAPDAIAQDEQSDLLGFLIVLAKHKKLVIGFPLAAFVVALVISLLLTKVYTATARIMPPQQNESTAASIFGALNGSIGVGGGAGPLGSLLNLKNPSELYVGMLKSWSIADALIERFHLQDVYE